MASNLSIGANDSSKFINSCWLYPYATSLALFLTIIQDSSSSFLNTHLVPIIGWLVGLGTSVQTLLFLN